MKRNKLLLLAFFVGLCQFAFAQNEDEFMMGCVFDKEKYEAVPASAPLMSRDYNSVPKSYSLKKYTPIPQNQGSQGSCTGWSSTYAARTIVYAIQNGITDRNVITSKAFSPSYAYNQVKVSEEDCSRGAYISDALDVLKLQGASPLSSFPYECNKQPSSSDKTTAANFKIQDYKRLEGFGTSLVSAMKKSLSEKKPVVISMKCFSSFSGAKDVWNGSPDNFRGYHAMAVIGYDDYKYGGAFEIMNSWGNTWGNEGYIWVRYDDFSRNCSEGYEMIEDFSKIVVDDDKPDLSGSLKLVKADGSDMKASYMQYSAEQQLVYKVGTQYSGTQFRIEFSNNEPAYVYIIGSDLTGKSSVVFPYNDSMSPALTYKSSSVAIPSEKHFIRMDDTKGTDYLCILYSKKPLDINSIKRQLEASYGDFHGRLNRVLASEMVSRTNVDFTQDKISFKAKSKGKSVVAMVVEVPHK